MTSPDHGCDLVQPWDTGFVSMWPVSTTRRPGPKLISPIALGLSGSTGCRPTPSNPESRITPARNAASGPSSPSTLGMRHTSRTSSTARSRCLRSTTGRAGRGETAGVVMASSGDISYTGCGCHFRGRSLRLSNLERPSPPHRQVLLCSMLKSPLASDIFLPRRGSRTTVGRANATAQAIRRASSEMATTVSEPGVPGALTGVDGAEIFRGNRPQREGDRSLETHGMSPIPEDQRYGAAWRNFTVWFAPNMELSGVFTGTLAFTLGLGFWPGFIAIVLGVILGALPVALLATWGPKTGMGQLPLARLPFGKTISVPAAVQWLSSVAWDALVGIFGGEAAQLLFHVPFWLGVIVVLALQGAIGFLGYEYIHQIEKWGSGILTVLFVVLSVQILRQGNIPTSNTVSGGAAVASFVLMTTIALSGSFSWASYAADYSRYMKKESRPQPIFLWTLAGLAASYIWMYTIGLAGAKVLV